MNFLVGQSGGPTAVINASLAGVYEAARRQGGRVLGMEHGVEGLLKGQVTDLGRLLEGRLPLELMTRFELVTSSLPRMCATSCATSACIGRRLIYSPETNAVPKTRGTFRSGADYGVRTRYLDLGKVALYQMS